MLIYESGKVRASSGRRGYENRNFEKKKEEKGKTCFQFYKKITPNIPSKIFHVEVKISFGKRAKVDLKG